MQRWDILGFGLVAVDDLIMVEHYPPPDVRIPVEEVVIQGGGLTGTALVAASRLGAKCAYAGVLGNDALSKWTLAELKRERIDCSPVIRRAGARPVHSFIIVDRTSHSRNIFAYRGGVMPRPMDKISETLLSKTRVLFVDHLGIENVLPAVLLAKKLGITTVGDFENAKHPMIGELLALIDHLILSYDFASEFTGEKDPAKALEILRDNADRACTAITVGKDGCFYIERNGKLRHHPAFQVEAVDTTGCGDVFHGAYTAGIANGHDVAYCIRFASAAAAIKATQKGGRAGIPDLPAVAQFMQERQASE